MEAAEEIRILQQYLSGEISKWQAMKAVEAENYIMLLAMIQEQGLEFTSKETGDADALADMLKAGVE